MFYPIKLVRLLLLFLLLSPCALAQQKTVAPQSLFGFNPLSNHYAPHSLAPVATYAQAWRKERPDLQLFISDSLLDHATKYYIKYIDTSLFNRILTYLNARKASGKVSLQDSALFDFPPSRNFLAAFDADHQKMRRFFSTPLAVWDTTKIFDPYAPSLLSQLFHSFQLQFAELSLWAPPRINAQLGPEIYPKDIFALLRHPNKLVVVTLTGAEIHALLEQIYAKRFYTLRSAQSDLLHVDLPPSMHQSIGGIPYKVELTKRKIEAPTLDPKKNYTVAMNSYAAEKMGKPSVEIDDYNTLLINYITQNKTPHNPESWRLAPERWVEEIKARERLFFRTK